MSYQLIANVVGQEKNGSYLNMGFSVHVKITIKLTSYVGRWLAAAVFDKFQCPLIKRYTRADGKN